MSAMRNEPSATGVSIERIERALLSVAQLCELDPIYEPIFARLDAELQGFRPNAKTLKNKRKLEVSCRKMSSKMSSNS